MQKEIKLLVSWIEFKNPNYDSSRAQKRNSSHEFTRFLGINAYPSTLFFDSQLNYISPVKGYLNPKQIEIYLHLFRDDKYKNIKSQEDFDGFVKNFKSKVNVKFTFYWLFQCKCPML